MKKFSAIVLSLCVALSACTTSIDTSSTEMKISYPEMEYKVVTYSVDGNLIATVTYDAITDTVSVDPSNTSQETLLMMLAVFGHKVPEYQVDLYFETAAPEEP